MLDGSGTTIPAADGPKIGRLRGNVEDLRTQVLVYAEKARFTGDNEMSTLCHELIGNLSMAMDNAQSILNLVNERNPRR